MVTFVLGGPSLGEIPVTFGRGTSSAAIFLHPYVSHSPVLSGIGTRSDLGCGHMYGSVRGRQMQQYKINPNPNPNPNTNPSSPYCIMRFIFGSRVHVPLCRFLARKLLFGALRLSSDNIDADQ